MAWKDNSAHVAFRYRFHCETCDHTFDMRSFERLVVMPDCPQCVAAGVEAAAATYVPPMPAIATSKSTAIKLAETMMQEMGLTDMQDNQRVGDIAIKPEAPKSTAEVEAEIRAMVEYQSHAAAELPTGPILGDGTRAIVPQDQRHLLVDPSAQRDNFWQGNAGGSAESSIGSTEVAKGASAAARMDGTEPLGLLERGRASGNMPLRIVPVGGDKAEDLPPALAQAQAARGAMP